MSYFFISLFQIFQHLHFVHLLLKTVQQIVLVKKSCHFNVKIFEKILEKALNQFHPQAKKACPNPACC